MRSADRDAREPNGYKCGPYGDEHGARWAEAQWMSMLLVQIRQLHIGEEVAVGVKECGTCKVLLPFLGSRLEPGVPAAPASSKAQEG